MITDISQQLASYKGILGWNALAGKWPAIEVEMFIKEHPVPIRKPKVSEIATVPLRDPATGVNLTTNALFFGAPDLLQLSLSGWIITPTASKQFAPVDKTGTALSVGNISYPELIWAFIEGRMNQTSTGYLQRKDPDYYISPYGHQYDSPLIATFDAQYTSNMRKQSFTMTLWLEQ